MRSESEASAIEPTKAKGRPRDVIPQHNRLDPAVGTIVAVATGIFAFTAASTWKNANS